MVPNRKDKDFIRVICYSGNTPLMIRSIPQAKRKCRSRTAKTTLSQLLNWLYLTNQITIYDDGKVVVEAMMKEIDKQPLDIEAKNLLKMKLIEANSLGVFN